MSELTLDEAIKHCEDIAGSCEWEAGRCDETDRYECHEMHELGKCAAEHRKLAEWLVELKERRAADVHPGKHGRWEENTGYGGWGDTYYRCSICGEEWNFTDGNPKSNGWHFCPNCGAKMDGETE